MADVPLVNKVLSKRQELTTVPVVDVPSAPSANDDITGDFLERRQNGIQTEGSLLRQQFEREQAERDSSALSVAGDVAETVVDVASDVGRGVMETPQQVIGGTLDALEEAGNTMEAMYPIGDLFQIGEDIDKYWNIPGFAKMSVSDRLKALSQLEPAIPEANSTTGNIIRDVSAFASAFNPASKGLQAVGVTGKIANPALAGVIADITAFNPFEERLSDLVQSYEVLQNPVTEFLASNQDDSVAMATLKQGLEGALGGVAADAFVYGLNAYKKWKAFRRTAAENGQTPEEMVTDLAAEDQALSVRLGIEEGEYIPFEQAADESIVVEIPKVKGGEQALDDAQNINLNNLETSEDVKTLIDKLAEANASEFDLARRGKIDNATTEALADDLGLTVEELLNRRGGEAFNAEQALAARQLLVASGETLVKLAQRATTGSDADLVLFRRAMAQHQAIQLQVSGLTAEAGRALQSFRIKAKSQQEQLRAIDELLSTSGGVEMSKDIAAMMSTLDDPRKVNKFVENASKASGKEMLYEFWINGLLSNPTTHTVNAISNTLVPILSISERKVASWIGTSVEDAESAMMAKGAVEGAKDGLRLAWQALKTGRPSDTLDKVEVDEKAAISAKNLNASGTAGRAADLLGNVVRVPGRLLTASDEFFKAVGYRMELNAQAYRMATSEGLEGEELAKRIAQIIENPPQNIHLAAVDFKRYQTFTNDLEKGGLAESLQRARRDSFKDGGDGKQIPKSNMYLRVILPFIRTPANIFNFAIERTPLAVVTSQFRAAISRGGADRDLALAKLSLGSTIMASTADLCLEGTVTGGGPSDPDMARVLRESGWQPYSVLVDGTYIPYSRLDPVGSIMGMACDATEILGQASETDALDIATAAVASMSKNLTSKTYLRGVSEAMDALTSGEPYKIENWISRQVSTVIPRGVAQLERVLSPEQTQYDRGFDGILQRIQSQIPGYNPNLPPRRNMFGEVVVLEGGLGPDFMSPFYISTKRDDPVIDEMVRQSVGVKMPKRSIRGIELDNWQYDELLLLSAGEGSDSLYSVLNSLMNSSQYQRLSDGPDGGKQFRIEKAVQGYQQQARAKFLQRNPDVVNQIEALAYENENKKVR